VINFDVSEECSYYGVDDWTVSTLTIDPNTTKATITGPGYEPVTFMGKQDEINFFQGGIEPQQMVLNELISFKDINQQNVQKIRDSEREAKAANELKEAAREIDEKRAEVKDLTAQKTALQTQLTAANTKKEETKSDRTKAAQQEIIDSLTPQIEKLESKITRA
jgi:hypothetical protein